ncbi:MBOAT family O-acyltransferase [Maribacter spongiicola]|uniref:MBOAT family O-acyltransferase n=1 Tax=Maribacter spongiicola TaxID=1206753 RepID=UPI001FBBB27E|nr:MBOAT family O-acyltransferase [Maribacter spongiicola]
MKQEYRNFFLLIASLGFYAWGEGILLLLMLFSIAINYISGLGINYFINKSILGSKVFLGLAIAINLGLLLYYKYANFIVEILQDFGFYLEYDHQNILLPIGISFFTFQGISYLVDVARQETSVQKNVFHLGLYISFFPQLIAGPIIRYHDVALEIKERTTNIDLFTSGVIRFIRGLAKKVIIANNAALIADQAFSIPMDSISQSSAWIGIICYSIQIYFDFSGYSDMAIGLGKMLGFNFKENFNYPYISKSIQDFWRRWHISLSTWFRDYLYIPLGGNRKSSWRTYFNLFLVFFVTGLWHGASWNFIFWGLFHGFFLILERSKILKTQNWPIFLQHLYVILIVIIGWVFFRAETMLDGFSYLKTMLGVSNGDNSIIFLYINNYSVLIILLAFIFSTPIRRIFNEKIMNTDYGLIKVFYLTGTKLFYLALLLFSIVELAQSGYNPFIYFRF